MIDFVEQRVIGVGVEGRHATDRLGREVALEVVEDDDEVLD